MHSTVVTLLHIGVNSLKRRWQQDEEWQETCFSFTAFFLLRNVPIVCARPHSGSRAAADGRRAHVPLCAPAFCFTPRSWHQEVCSAFCSSNVLRVFLLYTVYSNLPSRVLNKMAGYQCFLLLSRIAFQWIDTRGETGSRLTAAFCGSRRRRVSQHSTT